MVSSLMAAAMCLLAILLAFPYVAFYILRHVCKLKHSPDEPPLIPQRPPVIGHIIGLFRHGHPYLERLSMRFSELPIYTLHTFLTRTYVVNSPELVNAVQKNAKNLSFNPFIIAMMPRLFGVSGRDVEIASANNDMEQGHWGFLPEVHSSTYSSLSPGEDLDSMIATMLDATLDSINELSDKTQDGGIEINLYAWIRRETTASSLLSAYGPESPFSKDPSLCDAFWDFESQMTSLLIGIFPSITARKAYLARTRIAAAMKHYFTSNGQAQASELVRTRYEIGKRHGLSMETLSVFELGNCIGVLVNSVPTIFWLIHHIYSSPTLLASIRSELDTAFPTPCALPVHALQELCPLLAATYKEVLRYRAHHSSSRYVKADTRLLGKYLVRAHSIIQIPSSALHLNTQLWGADAAEFSPERFMRAKKPQRPALWNANSSFASLQSRTGDVEGSTSEADSPVTPTSALSTVNSLRSIKSSVALATTSGYDTPSGTERQNITHGTFKTRFRAFGGGKTLCPGRHFAMETILGTVAMMVRRLDVVPAGQVGWEELGQAEGKLASTIPPPDGDIRVKVTGRTDEGGEAWGWSFEGKGRRFEA